MFICAAPLVKYYNMTCVDDGAIPFKITCKSFNEYVICDGKSGEILKINFIYADMDTIAIYTEEIDQEIFVFK